MQINVSQLLRGSIGATRDIPVDDVAEIEGTKSRVRGRVKLTRTDRSILVQGTLRTEVEVTCSRCLRSCRCPLDAKIEEEYYQTRDVFSGATLPLPDEPGCFTVDNHHIIDLAEAVRQYVALAVPMKPLCRDDCAGLCPVCGRNLNEGQCDCPSADMDPRWSALGKPAAANKGRA